jgi:hypothetical protein
VAKGVELADEVAGLAVRVDAGRVEMRVAFAGRGRLDHLAR